MKRLINDRAIALGRVGLDVVGPYVPEGDRREVFDLLVEAARAAFEAYEEQADRAWRRLHGDPGGR